jgi:tetratricopeptide (TPR) repeat protein
VERSRFAEFVLDQGFVVSADMPWTHGVRYTTWTRGEDRITFAADAASGATLVRIDEVEGTDLGESIEARFRGQGPEAIIAASRRATDPREKVRAMFRMAALSYVAGPWRDEIAAALCERLSDAEPFVRWTSVRLLRSRIERGVEEALTAAAETYPDLAPAAESMRKLRRAHEEGTLYDGPTDSSQELVMRAREGVEKGQWKRVVAAAEALLKMRSNRGEGLYFRALAHENEGAEMLALALLGASVEEQEEERALSREDDQDAAAQDDLLKSAQAARDALRARVAAMDPRSRQGAVDSVIAWMHGALRDGWTRSGAAKALRGVVPELEAYVGFIASSFNGDAAGLAEVLERVPDSPVVIHQLGRALSRKEPPAARRHFEEALRRVRAGGELSPEAQRIEAVVAARNEIVNEATILEDLTQLVYESGAWDEAAQLSDELVRIAPDSTAAWQIRALSRTFGRRHEEAVIAYDDALRELDRIYVSEGEGGGIIIGADPRSQMRFNRSCVLAKLGRRDEAIEELRRAIRLDVKWAGRAKDDDYWEAYWSDAEFLRVASADPEALVTSEERDPAYIRRLVDRAKGLAYQGKVEKSLHESERAAELAAWAGHTELLVEALTGWGRTVALEQDAGAGLDLIERAWALAGPDGAVSAEVRAETAHNRAFVLHLAGQLDQAEEAYHHALSLRRDACGESSPVLAKSYGDLARLQVDRGASGDVVVATIDRGVRVLEQFLEGHAEQDEAWAEAALDLATLLVNRARMEAQGGDLARAGGSVEQGVSRLEEVTARGWSASPAFLENAGNLARALAQEAKGEGPKAAARSLVERLDTLLIPGSPEERRERLYWRSLRRVITQLRRARVDDPQIAGMLSQALRGGGDLPELLRSIPVLAELPAELAKRAARYSTFVVMAAMALSSAESGSSLDDAIENLEELCVAQILEQPGGGGETVYDDEGSPAH